MPHALLLSPDDQAVSAITGVLEEMSVTFERPLDGPSAAKKLNAQSFDLVLVDCENLPAAKLIFDVCRRSQTGTNPVPIAIVDGRAGLPTAFRLGAELILTKPVAKDQARTTIRTAVSRVRKEEPARAIHPVEESTPVAEQPATAELQAQAAAASASSSVATTSDKSPIAPPVGGTAVISSAAEEVATTTAAQKPASMSYGKLTVVPDVPATDMFKPTPKAPSDDPVLADLESDAPTPALTSHAAPQAKKKTSGSLITLLVLVLAGGGLYAAWMYQPGFRDIVQPLIDRAIGVVGHMSGGQQPASSQAAPVAAPVKPAPPTASTASPNADAGAIEASANTSNAAPATMDTTATTVSQVTPTTTAAAIPVPSASTAETTADVKKVTVAALPTETELPGEKSAVILSSQGAEKRLVLHSLPVYPADARRAGIEGTVVLKAIISDAGIVEGVRLVEGNPALATAAVAAVKKWHYRPYIREGKAMRFQTIVLVEFQRF